MDTPPVSENQTKKCYRCGVIIPASAVRCPKCGRNQFRICYCGNSIPVDASKCPICGADWSDSSRVRRKRHSSKISVRFLTKSAAVGAGIMLVIMFMANILIKYFAHIGASGEQMPTDLVSQMDRGLVGFGMVVSSMLQRLGAHGTSLLIVGVGLLVGAGIGAAAYLAKVGAIKIGRKKHHYDRVKHTE